MTDSEAKTDADVEQKVDDVTAVEGNSSSHTEPPSELELKIIKQVEVSDRNTSAIVTCLLKATWLDLTWFDNSDRFMC